MEKKEDYATSQYPAQMQPSAPPTGFIPATNYSGNSNETSDLPPNFGSVQVVIATQPPLQPTTSQSYNPRYPPQYVEDTPTGGCCKTYQKNRPQTSSVVAASLIFMSGGMNMAWSSLYTARLAFQMTLHMQICWFIAASIGALCSAVITNYVPKKPIFLFSSVLVIIGGILFAALPHDGAAIVAALYMDGIGNGLLIVAVLVMAGEEIASNMRGATTSTIEVVNYTVGMLLQIILATSFSIVTDSPMTFGATEVHGILSIIFGLIAFLLAMFLLIESPVYYLQRDDEDRAIDALRRLQRPFLVTHETYRLLDEQKGYVAANSAAPYTGISALLKLCVYRGLGALTFSKYTTYTFVITSAYTVDENSVWPYITASFLLWLGAIFAGCVMDWIGRKGPMLFGALVCGGMAIGVGVIFNDSMNFYYNLNIDTAFYLLLIMQFCAGLFISAAPVYSTEAFPLRLKSYYVALAFIVQMLVHIIVGACKTTLHGLAAYFITMGVLYLVFFLFALVGLPETKKYTLRDAQDKFRMVFNTRMLNFE